MSQRHRLFMYYLMHSAYPIAIGWGQRWIRWLGAQPERTQA